MNTQKQYLTGIRKFIVYCQIALHVAIHYALRPKLFNYSPIKYVVFLKRAAQLLLVFRHNKVVKTNHSYKLHLYLLAYPHKGFFHAIESKLCKSAPAPTTVVFSMTKACGYKCPHCYQRKDKGKDLDETLLLQVAKDMQELGVAMFDIEGGDPFLYFPRLLRLVQSLDERAEIWVNSTGANVSKEQLLQLKKVGLYGLMVSIHSPQKEEHDTFTGIEGSFKTACDVLTLCNDLGLATAINSVLSEPEINAGELTSLMELAKQLNCDYVQLIHPKPAGKWLGHKENMQKDADFLAKVRAAHVLYNSSKKRNYPSLAAQVFEESKNVLGCTAGAIDRFYINANGEIQPCEFLNISFGNIQKESFETIYQRMRSYFKEPGCDWLCCTQANAIYQLMLKHDLKQTPIPWEVTQELVATWQRGEETPIYKKLGIYQ